MISISGVPIYNAAHMLGFFSTFNASHFSKMTIRKQVTASDAINRIGGVLDMVHHDSIPPRTNGDFSVGLMSSQGTVRIPSGKRSTLTVSARISYLNMLYGSFLEIDGSMMEYSFSDINVTYLNKIDRNNTLYIDFYTGGDKVLLKDNASELYHDTSMEWGNMAVAAHWEYGKGDTRLRSSLYYSGYDNRMRMKGKYEIGLPSGIYDFAVGQITSLNNVLIISADIIISKTFLSKNIIFQCIFNDTVLISRIQYIDFSEKHF